MCTIHSYFHSYAYLTFEKLFHCRDTRSQFETLSTTRCSSSFSGKISQTTAGRPRSSTFRWANAGFEVKFHGYRVQLHISPPARSWLPSTYFTSNGQDLRKRPLVARKAALKPLINETEIQFSKSFEIDGRR